jgi:hypothetical protein
MNVELRSSWGESWIKGTGAKFVEAYNQAEMAYSLGIESALGVEANKATALFKQKKSDKAEETLTSKTGVGYPRLTDEGEDYAMDSRLPGYKTVFKFIKKTNGVEITEEFKDDRDKELQDKFDEARDLHIGFKMEFDRSAFSVLNYAFTAQASLPSDITYYSDGKPLCSTGHPRKDGGTAQSNASATGLPLSETNLEVAKQAIRRQLDDRGMPMAIGSGRLMLIVPDSLEKTAYILTNSTKRPSTANNDINIYDGTVTVVSTKWINSQNGGSDTQWFLVDSLYSPFIFYQRQGVKSRVYVDNKNKNTIYDVSARWQVGFKNWRGVWGSKGDNAAYSS